MTDDKSKIADDKSKIADELKKMEYEPLLPVEITLVKWRL